jgi:hypothetical protein
MELCELIRILEDERDNFQRECDRAIRQKDLYNANHAMGGKDACDRVLRLLQARVNAQADRDRRRERNHARSTAHGTGPKLESRTNAKAS